MFNLSTKIGTACAGLITAGAVGLALASPASADTSSIGNNTFHPYGSKGDQSVTEYMQELRDVGGRPTYYEADQVAAGVCSSLGAGQSDDSLLNQIVAETQIARNQAKVAVWGAEWHFCPSYY
jgi:hypothetical protein